MASHPASVLKTGASWFISACVVIVTAGLVLLAYGLWRSPVHKPDPDELRQQFDTRHAALRCLADSPALAANRNNLARADEVIAFLRDAARLHKEATDKLADHDATVWKWSRAIATSYCDTEKQVEYWYVFHSERLDFFKLEARDLRTHAVQFAFRHETDGRVTFRRARDGASFATHTNGALASVTVPLADGSICGASWDEHGAMHERRPAAR
ncbi:MAG: hypothetical protein HY300_03430 [Verrucomicrobia bacterium]|nr:hypothetical protein [Verrucomicrobiota bacterium]